MGKFQITIYRDLTQVKKTLKGAPLLIYTGLTNSVFLTIKGLFLTINKEFRDEISNNEITLSIVNDNIEILKQEHNKVNAFLMGDVSKIKENNKFKRIDQRLHANRWFSKFYKWTKARIEDSIIQNSVITYLGACSVFIDLDIDPDYKA